MDATLTHTRRLVDNYTECLVFYRDVLDLEVTHGDESSGYADLDAGEATLALFDRDEMDAVVDMYEGAPGTEVVLVFAVDSVDDAAEAVSERGAAIVTEPTDREAWGIRTAHVRDPDGGLIELAEPL
jgi:lactoylglutathione lyase